MFMYQLVDKDNGIKHPFKVSVSRYGHLTFISKFPLVLQEKIRKTQSNYDIGQKKRPGRPRKYAASPPMEPESIPLGFTSNGKETEKFGQSAEKVAVDINLNLPAGKPVISTEVSGNPGQLLQPLDVPPRDLADVPPQPTYVYQPGEQNPSHPAHPVDTDVVEVFEGDKILIDLNGNEIEAVVVKTFPSSDEMRVRLVDGKYDVVVPSSAFLKKFYET